MQRRTLIATACTLAALAWAGPAAAQNWPTQPVKIVVPAPAGSSLDIIARLLGDKLKDRWGQPVVVENKAGAGGMLGVDVAAKAVPDGHTLAVGFNGPIAFAPFLYSRMPYNPGKDLIPVVMTTSQPNVLAVSADLPVKTVKEFVDWGNQLLHAEKARDRRAAQAARGAVAVLGARGIHDPVDLSAFTEVWMATVGALVDWWIRHPETSTDAMIARCRRLMGTLWSGTTAASSAGQHDG